MNLQQRSRRQAALTLELQRFPGDGGASVLGLKLTRSSYTLFRMRYDVPSSSHT